MVRVDMSSEGQGLPEDFEPLTAGEEIVPTIYGEENIGEPDADVTVDPEGGTATATLDEDLLASGLAGAAGERARLAGGLWNADFALGPPRSYEAIDENNPLPYWKVGHVQKGAVFLQYNGWGDNGYLTAEGYDVAEGDDVYLEQVVPVAGYGHQKVLLPMCLYGTDIDAAGGTYDLYGWVEYELYDRSGNSLGDAEIALQGGGQSLHRDPGDDEAAFILVELTEAAKWMRVRLLVSAMSPASGYQRQYIIGSSAAPPSLWYVHERYVHENLPSSGAVGWFGATYGQGVSGVGTVNGQHIAAGYGWVTAVTGRTSAARSGGQTAWGFYSLSDSDWVGPMVRANATVDGNTQPYLRGIGRYNPDVNDATGNATTHLGNDPKYNYINAGDRYNVRSEVVSGTWAPTSADGHCEVSCAYIDELYPDATNDST